MSRDTLLVAVWPRILVSDIGFSVYIREIRQALDDDSHAPRYIQPYTGVVIAFEMLT